MDGKRRGGGGRSEREGERRGGVDAQEVGDEGEGEGGE
jgi:hypothetical protein